MNISKELGKLLSGDSGYTEVLDDIDQQYSDLAKQQADLLKKSHLLKIVNLANKLEQYVEQNIFSEKGIKGLEIECHENQYGGEVRFWFIGDEMIQVAHGVEKEDALVEAAFREIRNFNFEYASENLYSGHAGQKLISLKPGVSKKLMDIFLSDELKAVYEYSKMHLEIPENNKNKEVKLKV